MLENSDLCVIFYYYYLSILLLLLLLGTVIIMCKNEVFDLNELHGMMQGRPTRLESKFRYGTGTQGSILTTIDTIRTGQRCGAGAFFVS